MLKTLVIALTLSYGNCALGIGGRDISSEVLVKFKLNVAKERIDELMKSHHLAVIERYDLIQNLFLCRVLDGQDVPRLIQTLNRDPDMEYAERNQGVKALQPEISIQ